MDFCNQVSELDGYLKLLQRFCKKRCDYSVNAINIELDDVEQSAKQFVSSFDDIVEYNGLEKISFSDFQNILTKYVYSNINISDQNMVKLIDWDITEYFGLASTIKNPEGNFNPLVSNGGWQLKISSNFYEDCTIVLVEYGDQAIVFSLGMRKNDEGASI